MSITPEIIDITDLMTSLYGFGRTPGLPGGSPMVSITNGFYDVTNTVDVICLPTSDKTIDEKAMGTCEKTDAKGNVLNVYVTDRGFMKDSAVTYKNTSDTTYRKYSNGDPTTKYVRTDKNSSYTLYTK